MKVEVGDYDHCGEILIYYEKRETSNRNEFDETRRIDWKGT